MTAIRPTVTAYFDLDPTGGPFFTLDDTVRGVLDNVTYTLGGPIGTDITPYVLGVSSRRGRDRQTDEFQAGVATVQVLNTNRIFDPNYSGAGDVLTDEFGIVLTDESGAPLLVGGGAAAPFFGDLLPGRRVTIADLGITVFDGTIDDWQFSYDVDGMSTVVFDVVDALADLASKEFDAWTADPGQLPGDRLNTILDRSEVSFPSGQRAIDPGTSSLQGDAVSWGSNALNYAQLVAKSDIGRLFASRENTLTFLGRNHAFTGVGAPILADDGTGIPYSGIARARGTELLYNRVGVDRSGGIQQTVNDPASQATYKIRSLSLTGLLMDSDDQSLGMANYLLGLYKDPQTRIASLTVYVHGLSGAYQPVVLGLDIGDVVQVIYTPNGVGDPLDTFCLIEGRSDQMGSVSHTITFALSLLADGFAGTPFVLDDPVFGVLDANFLGF